MVRWVVLAVLVAVSGCGSSDFDRVSTGAGTGAGTGALFGLIGGPIGVAVGAAIGAGVGAVAGGSTSPEDVNLGKPAWKQ